MKTIMQQMNKGKAAREKETIKQKLIGYYEQRLNYAYDFTPHKVEYYKQLLNEAKQM